MPLWSNQTTYTNGHRQVAREIARADGDQITKANASNCAQSAQSRSAVQHGAVIALRCIDGIVSDVLRSLGGLSRTRHILGRPWILLHKTVHKVYLLGALRGVRTRCNSLSKVWFKWRAARSASCVSRAVTTT